MEDPASTSWLLASSMPSAAPGARRALAVVAATGAVSFPTIAEYDEAARRYPEPILSGEEDMMRLDNSIFFDEVYEAATLSREDLAGA
jgi:hypothetical protein